MNVLDPDSMGRTRVEQYHQETEALWFSVEQEQSGELRLVEKSRFSQLVDDYNHSFGLDGPCYPRLASFTGNTGAGKSSLIHLLMKHPWSISKDARFTEKLEAIAVPVVGKPNSTIPTSGNVHLYCDMLPDQSHLSQPLLLADSEGSYGGSQLPATISSQLHTENTSSNKERDGKLRKLQGTIQWALSLPTHFQQQRASAVNELFPRVLYNFSDVVVHVVINAASRALERDIVRLLEWANSVRTSAVNRALLPHLVVVLNLSEPDSSQRADQSSFWDPEVTTATILNEHQNALFDNETIRKHRITLERLGTRVQTLEELLNYFYSSVQFIRLPNGKDCARLSRQLQLLHSMINCTSSSAQEAKRCAKMRLPSEDLNLFFRLAFDHYSTKLDIPFSFLETIFSLHPLPNKLASNYFDIMRAAKIADERAGRPAAEFCDVIVPTICSSIALDAFRTWKRLPGTIPDIFKPESQNHDGAIIPGTYQSQLRDAVKMFEDRSFTCEFVSPDGQKCTCLFLGHPKNFHTGKKGSIIGIGPFESRFLDELNQILDVRVLAALEHIDVVIQQFSDPLLYGTEANSKLSIVWKIHESNLKALHEAVPSLAGCGSFGCAWCFRGLPVATLPCGHEICKDCVPFVGTQFERRDPRLFHFNRCVLHANRTELMSFNVLLLPEGIGRRLLSLDSGGSSSFFQLEILAAIEKEFGGKIRIQRFFDMICGSGTGGLLALGIGECDWTVSEAYTKFRALKDGLQQHSFWRKLTESVSHQTTTWENAIQAVYGYEANQPIMGARVS